MTTLLLLATISIWRMGGDIHVADAPNGASLYTMGGDIRIGRAAGHTVAKTMGGNIEIEDLEGSALASTMGGNVRVNVGPSGAGHDLELYSMGGEVELILPANFDGKFDIELREGDSTSGRVISDFPLNVHESTRWSMFGGRHIVEIATGKSGSGANHVRITTIGADIRIRRR